MKSFKIMEKFYSSKALLKMAGGRDAYPFPPGYAWNYRKIGNLPIKGPILSCFNIKPGETFCLLTDIYLELRLYQL